MEILSAGNGMSPAWSPHGDQIAFMSNRTEGWHLYTMRADGSDVQRLTAGPSPDSPSWSPDGAQLAFERDGQIEAIRADGSERRILPTGIEACAQPVWCPDGERIAFVADGGIWAIAFDDEESRPLTGGDGESQPAWAADGSLFFVRVTGIHRLAPDGTEERVTQSREDAEPAPSPDGGRLAFSRGGQLMLLDLESGATGMFQNAPVHVSHPSWAPDGDRLVHAAYVNGSWDIYVAGTGDDEIRVLTASTWVNG